MVARLTGAEQQNFIGLISAMGAADACEATRCVIGFAENTHLASSRNKLTPSGTALERDMKALFARTCRGYGTGIDIGEARASECEGNCKCLIRDAAVLPAGNAWRARPCARTSRRDWGQLCDPFRECKWRAPLRASA